MRGRRHAPEVGRKGGENADGHGREPGYDMTFALG